MIKLWTLVQYAKTSPVGHLIGARGFDGPEITQDTPVIEAAPVLKLLDEVDEVLRLCSRVDQNSFYLARYEADKLLNKIKEVRNV